MSNKASRVVDDPHRGERGGVAIFIALTLTMILGFVALGTEIVFVLLKHREMQTVADASAVGAATALQTGTPADFRTEGNAIAATAGFVTGAGGVTITINNPPASGPYAANAGAVEVIVDQPQTLALISLFVSGTMDVGARAVAVAGSSGACVLQLTPGANPGVSLQNSATVNLVGCSFAANSTGTPALQGQASSLLNALSVSTSGTVSLKNGATINATYGVKTNQPAVADPYASVSAPPYAGCTYNNASYGNGNWPLSPGVYCNGLSLAQNAQVTMNPGVYIIDRGTFSVGSSVNLTGAGVTIYLTSSTGANYANISIGNGSRITLSAPTTGAMAGLLFFSDRNSPGTTADTFGGGATMNLTGTIYLPTHNVTFRSDANNPSGCTQLIGGVLQFVQSSRFQNNCPTGVRPIAASASTLVE